MTIIMIIYTVHIIMYSINYHNYIHYIYIYIYVFYRIEFEHILEIVINMDTNIRKMHMSYHYDSTYMNLFI